MMCVYVSLCVQYLISCTLKVLTTIEVMNIVVLQMYYMLVLMSEHISDKYAGTP